MSEVSDTVVPALQQILGLLDDITGSVATIRQDLRVVVSSLDRIEAEVEKFGRTLDRCEARVGRIERRLDALGV